MDDYIEQFRTLAALAAKEVGADDVEAAMFQGGVLLLLARLKDKCQETERPWWYREETNGNWIKRDA